MIGGEHLEIFLDFSSRRLYSEILSTSSGFKLAPICSTSTCYHRYEGSFNYVMTVGFSRPVNSTSFETLRATSMSGLRPSWVSLPYSASFLLYFST